jgi:hypothetical protein
VLREIAKTTMQYKLTVFLIASFEELHSQADGHMQCVADPLHNVKVCGGTASTNEWALFSFYGVCFPRFPLLSARALALQCYILRPHTPPLDSARTGENADKKYHDIDAGATATQTLADAESGEVQADSV